MQSVRSWWQHIKIHPVRIILIALVAVVIVLIFLSILGYIFSWHWTGLVPETSEPKQHWKTLWDWLQLLIIPAVLAVAGYVINLTINRGEQVATEQRAKSEREAAEKRAETESAIALDNQREASLQEYIDKMSELILHEGLLEPDPKKEVQNIARVRTLTVLLRLDSKRKKSVLKFLLESGLINKGNPIIFLFGADLSEVDLSFTSFYKAFLSDVNLGKANLVASYLGESVLAGADLSHAKLYIAKLPEADLSAANLTNAILAEAVLYRANLDSANLFQADLTGAYLIEANLKSTIVTAEQLAKAKSLKGATMPDGSIHP